MLAFALGVAAPFAAATDPLRPEEIEDHGQSVLARAGGISYTVADFSEDLRVRPRLDLLAESGGDPAAFVRRYVEWRIGLHLLSRRSAAKSVDAVREETLHRLTPDGSEATLRAGSTEDSHHFWQRALENAALHDARQRVLRATPAIPGAKGSYTSLVTLEETILPLNGRNEARVKADLLDQISRVNRGEITKDAMLNPLRAQTEGSRVREMLPVRDDLLPDELRHALQDAKPGTCVLFQSEEGFQIIALLNQESLSRRARTQLQDRDVAKTRFFAADAAVQADLKQEREKAGFKIEEDSLPTAVEIVEGAGATTSSSRGS